MMMMMMTPLNMGTEKARISYKTCLTNLRNIVTQDEIQIMSGISSNVATRRLANPERAT